MANQTNLNLHANLLSSALLYATRGRIVADQYIAGCIILAAAPCTAMVFVWSHLTKGDPAIRC